MIKYNACDFFMTRTPFAPVNDYLTMFNNSSTNLGERLKKSFENSMLNEALAVASEDLLVATTNGDFEVKSKSSDQIRSSLTKYFIRQSTRPTPFGLFSGISIGKFGSGTDITISDSGKHTKRARPDMEWIYGVIKKIETEKHIRNHLKVRFNDFTFANGNRIDKPNKTFMQLENRSSNMPELSTSIRYTEQVKAIEEKCNDFYSYSTLLDSIISRNPNTPVNKIEIFLSQLLENEFLLSELRPPLINTDMLEYLLCILENIKDVEEVDLYIQKLKMIQKSIADYNSTAVGEGIDIYAETIRLQKELHECKNYLQIDMKTHTESNMLDLSLKKELEQFVSAMIRMAPVDRTSDEMARYTDLFLERYGYSAEVPLLELLDMDKGLGAPMHYQVDKINHIVPKRPKDPKEQRIGIMLERKLMSALRERRKVINITDSDIDYVCEGELDVTVNHPMDCSQSFELFLTPHPGDEYDFTFVSMSDGIGKTFGRFSDMLTDEEALLLEENVAKNKTLLDEYAVVEIAELPANGRFSNVSINNSDYDYQIALTTNTCKGKQVLNIRDIYIGIDSANNQFYIRSKTLEKNILITMTSMLNTTHSSNALRFLTEISAKRKRKIVDSIYSFNNLPYEYFPRITYNKIIIKPETWIISKDILGLKHESKRKRNADAFDESFEQYRRKWLLPRYILLCESDNRLLLDLDNPAHRHEVFNVLNKSTAQPIILTELTCDFNAHAATNAEGEKYITEIVVPFIFSPDKKKAVKNSAEKDTDNVLKTQSSVSINRMNLDREQLMLLPGNDEWLYYKLLVGNKRQNELLSLSHQTLESFVANGFLKKYFFIRYADPEPHIRLRVQSSADGISSLFVAINDWFNELYADGLISKVINDSYMREAERYGGLQLIQYAENYFFHNSKLAMNLLVIQRYKQPSMNMDYMGVSFIISVLESFGLSMEQQEKLLDSLTNRKNYKKEFQNSRQTIMCAVDSSDDWFDIRSRITNPEVYDLINADTHELRKYAQAVYASDERGELTNSIKSIVTSVIHMFCNRLMGSNAWEQKIYALTRHGVSSLRGYLKHNKSKQHIAELPDSLI